MINHRHYHEATKEITEYRAIDGNWVKAPEGYCSRYKGYLTKKQIAVHGCMKRHGGICGRFQTVKGEYVKRMNQQQFYDKMLSRMDKMAASLDKIARSLEAISKAKDMEIDFLEKDFAEILCNAETSKNIDMKCNRIILDNTLARLKPENTSNDVDMTDENV